MNISIWVPSILVKSPKDCLLSNYPGTKGQRDKLKIFPRDRTGFLKPVPSRPVGQNGTGTRKLEKIGTKLKKKTLKKGGEKRESNIF